MTQNNEQKIHKLSEQKKLLPQKLKWETTADTHNLLLLFVPAENTMQSRYFYNFTI